MKHSNIFIITLFLISTLLIPCFSFNIVDKGKATSVVVLGDDAIAPEKNAANEFVSYIEKISGVKLSIVNKPSAEKGNIFIGQTSETKKVLGTFKWNQITDDGIIIKTGKDFLVLAGDRPRGTLYAVYTYLEDYLGCMFLSKDAEIVPSKKTIIVQSMNIVYNPPFMSREAYYKTNMDDPSFAIKLKLNGQHNFISDDWGGHITLLGWCHTLPSLISVEKYGQTHPEWFALRGGKRVMTGHDQVCLSNKEMIAELTKNVLEKLKETPNTKLISVTQADNYEYCECDNCKKLTEEYGHSGALLTVINQVANEVKKYYPDTYVETLAYQYTRQAPKNIKPDDNVIIRLCTIECDYATPLNSQNNASFYKDLTDWKNIAKNLYIWDYTVNFSNYHIIHPNFQSLQKNVQIFSQNNVKAVFEQGDSFNSNLALSHLKSWILAKLLWNPNLNYDATIREYLNAYYGPAGKDIYNYLNIVTTAVEREHPYLRCYMGGNPYFKAEDFIDAFKALNLAVEKVKDEPILKDRVLCELYSFQTGWLVASRDVVKEVSDSGVLSDYSNRAKFMKMYYDFAKAHDNGYIGEGGALETSIFAFSSSSNKEGTIPNECKDIPSDNWFDFQEKSFNFALGEGQYAKKVEDNDASNKLAAFMTPNHTQWAIQRPISSLFLDDNFDNIDLYATYKVIQKNNKNTPAYEIGVYDPNAGTTILSYNINSNDTPDGKYITKYIGSLPYETNSGSYIYVCPKNDETSSDGLYLDRIFAILKTNKKPDFLNNISRDNYKTYEDKEFRLAEKDKSVFIVEDKDAIDGSAASMPNNHSVWAIQMPLNNVTNYEKVDIYARIKINSVSGQNSALNCGVYNSADKTYPLSTTIPFSNLPINKYGDVFLGTVTTNKDSYLYLYPDVNGSSDDTIYIDNIVFVKK